MRSVVVKAPGFCIGLWPMPDPDSWASLQA